MKPGTTKRVRRSVTRLAPVLALLLLNACPESQVTEPPGDDIGQWLTRAALPTPRQEVPHAVLGGKIYVPGGLAQGGIGATTVEIFDPASNRWFSAAPLPIPLHHLALAPVNGKVYAIGGYQGSQFQASDRVFEYDPNSDVWSEKTPMPSSRGALVAVALDGKIYAIGGARGGTALSTNEMYDPLGDNWTPRAPMPTAREHLAAAVIDNVIYVVGGRSVVPGSGVVNSTRLEAYSPTGDSWVRLADMPTARGGLAAAALNGRLYAFGGEIPGVFSESEEYDPNTNRWRPVAAMRTPRHGMGAVSVADTIFVIGGAIVQGFGVSGANEAFTLTKTATAAE